MSYVDIFFTLLNFTIWIYILYKIANIQLELEKIPELEKRINELTSESSSHFHKITSLRFDLSKNYTSLEKQIINLREATTENPKIVFQLNKEE